MDFHWSSRIRRPPGQKWAFTGGRRFEGLRKKQTFTGGRGFVDLQDKNWPSLTAKATEDCKQKTTLISASLRGCTAFAQRLRMLSPLLLNHLTLALWMKGKLLCSPYVNNMYSMYQVEALHMSLRPPPTPPSLLASGGCAARPSPPRLSWDKEKKAAVVVSCHEETNCQTSIGIISWSCRRGVNPFL